MPSVFGGCLSGRISCFLLEWEISQNLPGVLRISCQSSIGQGVKWCKAISSLQVMNLSPSIWTLHLLQRVRHCCAFCSGAWDSPILPRYTDSSFLIAPYAVHQPVSHSCIQALPYSNCAMLTVLFLQAWQAPYAVHQRIAGLYLLHKSLSNMKVHKYDLDFFSGCFKDTQQKLRMQILSNALPEILGVWYVLNHTTINRNWWSYQSDLYYTPVPENSHLNKSGNSLNNSNEPYEAHIVPRLNLVFVAAIDYDPEYKIRIAGHWINHFHLWWC